MSTEENKAIVRRYREAHNTNNLDALDEIVAADLITHALLPGMPPGREGGKMVHQGVLEMFPDMQVTTEDLIAEGDRVFERFSARGTDKGGFMGMPPTGKSFTTTGMIVYRIANGKIVEHWGVNDTVGLMQQLGHMPKSG